MRKVEKNRIEKDKWKIISKPGENILVSQKKFAKEIMYSVKKKKRDDS